MKIIVQQHRNAKIINKKYQINLYIHMQNYKHFKPIKGHLKVVFELLLKFWGEILYVLMNSVVILKIS